MANLFVVHTPLTFFVAQNIILQEKLTNNILLIRNVEDSKGFDEAYRTLKINELWDHELSITDSRKWKDSFFKTSITYIQNEKKIMRIIQKHHVHSIFYGDINDLRNRLEYLRMMSLGITINIYEEGSSHYARLTYINNKKLIAGAIFFDFFIKFPSIRLDYLKYLKYSDQQLFNQIITKRFNILPQREKMPFDYPLHTSTKLSKEVENKLNEVKESLMFENGSLENIAIFISEPLFNRAFICDEIIRRVTNSMFESLKDYLSNKLLAVKFHPRETEEDQKIITNILEKNGIRYCILNTHKSIPLEVYLQNIKFDLLISFCSSCTLYSGYIYNYVPCKLYIKDYLKILKEEINIQNREWYILNVERSIAYIDFLESQRLH